MYLDSMGVPSTDNPRTDERPLDATSSTAAGPGGPRFVTVSTEEELAEASREVIAGKIDAIRCTGMVVPGVRETFDHLLDAGSGTAIDALLGLPTTVQTVFSDFIERGGDLTGIVQDRDLHKLVEFIKAFRIKHPVVVSISVGTFAVTLLRARHSSRRRRETIDSKPFGPVCAALFRRGFRVRDNNGEAITLRRDIAIRPSA